ncbi:HAD family hydrolase [Bradyrhizobium jicamae]|uniref:HAD-IIIC family phosphatase n=1 Tax=Bradyrhizobium jicamae TaxID=280332 RepID=UPI001BACD08E|nr:HAD-IIIC family phosphatase [Bradyrhizobium jicamae]MBR0934928.1 HAD family hydrolase [Bradyrhizobium jicamae]
MAKNTPSNCRIIFEQHAYIIGWIFPHGCGSFAPFAAKHELRSTVSAELYRELSWLPRPPDDFATSCKQLTKTESEVGKQIRFLATHALDERQLSRLGRAIAIVREQGRSLKPLVPFKLGLVGNGTLDLMVPVLVATAARHGFALECVTGAYDQFLQDSLQPDSSLNTSRPDAVLIALDHRGLALQPSPGNEEIAAQTVDSAIGLVNTIRAGFARNSNAVCILQTLAAPPEGLFGSFDRALKGTARNLVDRFNQEVCQAVLQSTDLLLDVAGIAETVGLADWHSPAQWNLAKLPFSDDFVPLYAEHVCRIIGALRGKSRRCLVLDLDNTVWGGVIGDDGLEGIQLAQGDATGEAFLSVQQLALALRARGVVLAVSSKNTDSIARRPFKEHPDMLLREDHIAVFQANWDDKATNIRAIAKELSLGLDSFVFLDDNPVERGLIRREIPEVAVPELDSDPAGYARTLAAAGYFEAIGFSDEDRARADMYQANARRLSLQGQTSDLPSYLRSLEMRIVFGAFDPTTRSRVTQLINKSNQFNLTTRRYTEAQIEQLEGSDDVMTLHVRLFDKFGDNGIICVIICRPSRPGTWTIDTWLMSCRVLGRCVEQAVLSEILNRARAAGISTLEGRYIPTERNEMVREHYGKLGFTRVEEGPDGSSRWELSTDTELGDLPMTVEREQPQLQPA